MAFESTSRRGRMSSYCQARRHLSRSCDTARHCHAVRRALQTDRNSLLNGAPDGGMGQFAASRTVVRADWPSPVKDAAVIQFPSHGATTGGPRRGGRRGCAPGGHNAAEEAIGCWKRDSRVRLFDGQVRHFRTESRCVQSPDRSRARYAGMTREALFRRAFRFASVWLFATDFGLIARVVGRSTPQCEAIRTRFYRWGTQNAGTQARRCGA